MRTVKVMAFVSAVVFGIMLCGCAFGAQGEGYFGNDANMPSIEEDLPEVETIPEPVKNTPSTNNNQEYRPPVMPEMPEYEQEEEKTLPVNKNVKNLEKYSEDTEKVLKSYGLDYNTYISLLNQHKDSAKGKGNREKSDRFQITYNEHPYDFLAAYRVAQANMEMNRKGQAEEWLKKALAINPKYVPAQQLLKKARAR